MLLQTIQAIPLESAFVPTCLENIIDKKIAKVALNILEIVVDFILSYIYCPYYHLYSSKLERIHTFSDKETILIDATEKGVASIEYDWAQDYISVNKTKVLFSTDENIPFNFSQKNNTHFVAVFDRLSAGQGQYKVIEQEIATEKNPHPMLKHWYINGSEKHQYEDGQTFLRAKSR